MNGARGTIDDSLTLQNRIIIPEDKFMNTVLCIAIGVLSALPAQAQWAITTLPAGGASTTISCIGESSTSLYVGSGLSVYRSTNNGADWSMTGAVAAPGIVALLGVGSTMFCATLVDGSLGGVFRSTDDGTGWTQVYNPGGGFNAPTVNTVAASSNNATIFAGSGGGPAGSFARSTDNGSTWSPTTAGLPEHLPINWLQSNSGSMFAAVNITRGIFKSTDDGANWAPDSAGFLGVPRHLYSSAANLYAISDSGLFIKANGAVKWTAINTGGVGTVSAIAVSGQTLFVAYTTAGVFRSTSGGAAWDSINTGLTEHSVNTLGIVGGTYLLAGTATLVWRRPLSQVSTGIELSANKLAHEFSLSQNYPNPFNPTTTIRYDIPNRSQVTLAVFNVLGQQVAQLLNGEVDSGVHEVKFDGGNLASGMYFYRIQAGMYTETRKLLLAR